jgi:hypothetical protein
VTISGMLASSPMPDYNHNGIVDAADFTVWRDTLGRTGTGLAADGNGDGIVDQIDLQFWKVRFGNHAASGATAVVPEPSTLLIAGITCFFLAFSCPCR